MADVSEYGGEFRVRSGDTWVPQLAHPNSPAFRAKAAKYQAMVSTKTNKGPSLVKNIIYRPFS